jgi:uncharacterized protein (TIGR02271 family)
MISTTSIETLIGQDVVDSVGEKIGTVGQVYVDTTSGEPTWASVKTGLFGLSESFVPLADAAEGTDGLRVGYEKEFVKDAPRVDPDQGLSAEEENRLYSYYGVNDISETTVDDVNTGAGYATADSVADTTADTTEGYDTSGPTTDDAMTRSEEQLHVGTERVESGRARLRKFVVTENQTVTVPVSHDEVRLVREPITDANAGAAHAGPGISEEEHEVVLTEDRVVVQKQTVPVERVALGTETVTEQQQVDETVRKEQIELEDGVDTTARTV